MASLTSDPSGSSSGVEHGDGGFVEWVLKLPMRAELIRECPALALIVFQYLTSGSRNHFMVSSSNSAAHSEDDELSRYLSKADSATLLLQGLEQATAAHSPAQRSGTASNVTDALAYAALHTLMDPRSPWLAEPRNLCTVNDTQTLEDVIHSSRCVALPSEWLSKAVRSSCERLQSIILVVQECCSDASLQPFRQRSAQVLSLLRCAGIVGEATNQPTMSGKGLAFCMSSPSTQLQILLRAVAMEAGRDDATLGIVLRYFAVLLAAPTSLRAFPFPTKGDTRAPLLLKLLVSLRDVGLIHAVRSQGGEFFVVSPCFSIAMSEGGIESPMLRRAMTEVVGVDGDQDVALQRTKRRLRRDEEEDTVITETNFRIYAYSSKKSLLTVLDQFAERLTAVEGYLVAYQLTRDAFVAAVRRGVTADQVVAFLSLKAHPCMRQRAVRESLREESSHHKDETQQLATTRSSLLPQSIIDQLKMWESDCSRMSVKEGQIRLFDLSFGQFDEIVASIRAYCDDSAAHVAYLNRDVGELIVSAELFEDVLRPVLEGGT